METGEVNILYHYTSLDALYAIIDEINNDDPNDVFFKLRATHASFLNDLSEGRLLPNALKTLGASDEVLQIIQNTMGYPFVVSLSELRDDLNMWRCYANKGEGVSIGIDKVELDIAVNENNNCKLDKCEYVKEEELVNLLKEKGADKMISNKNVLSMFQILRDALIFKDSSFHAEAEWRIHDFNLETKYRISDNVIIPYREIRIPVSAIKSITLGPKCNRDKNLFSLNRMLKSKIGGSFFREDFFSCSKIPYK